MSLRKERNNKIFQAVLSGYTGRKVDKMNTMRKNLIDRMVKIYGFEHPVVIQFTELCERWKDTKDNDKVLRIIVESHEEFPVLE